MNDFNLIKQMITNFVKESPLNVVKELDNLTIYSEPVVGCASAHDPLFEKLKKPAVIGPHHISPIEWLPEAKTVISYFLPFSKTIRETNALTKEMPSTEWVYGRIEGEALNDALRQFLVDKFSEFGEKAVAPSIDPRFQKITRTCSNWSERHAAFIAGLGTFNLSKSFITEKGCAGRFGSVIVSAEYPPTLRIYSDIYELCNNCGVCIDRCPTGAITPEGKDHSICAKYIDENIKPRFHPRYGCGKCQTAVPCEDRIPK